MQKTNEKMRKSNNNNNSEYRGERRDKKPKIKRGKNNWNEM